MSQNAESPALHLFRLAAVLALTAASTATAVELDRAGFLGAQVAPLTAADRDRAGLNEAAGGLVVRAVVPGSAAERSGLAADDVVIAVDDLPVADPSAFVRAIAGRRAGDRVRIQMLRAGEPRSIEATLLERPREQSDAHKVIYGSVPAPGGLLRTIVTRPQGEGPFPALLLIQGLGCYSVENPTGDLAGYAVILEGFSRAGFVTMRVEKPGCGDSLGGPCPEIDFSTELDGYRRGLQTLQGLPFVDPDRVIIFGHSMGGVMGPLLAVDEPVRGLAVYGTVVKTWFEYLLENSRRQLLLAGTPAAEVDRTLRDQSRYLAAFLLQGKSLRQIAEEQPELRPRIEQEAPDLDHMFGRNPAFFQHLAALNLPAAWQRVDADVLAIWGRADYVSSPDDHEQIAAIINDRHPGRAQYVPLDDTDHGFFRASGCEEAFNRDGPGELNPEIVGILVNWARSITAADRSTAASSQP